MAKKRATLRREGREGRKIYYFYNQEIDLDRIAG